MSEDLTEKENIIKSIYFNRVSGFGSVADTLKQAKQKDVNITYDDKIFRWIKTSSNTFQI